MDRGDVGWQGLARTGKWEGKGEGGQTGRNTACASRGRGREEKQAGACGNIITGRHTRGNLKDRHSLPLLVVDLFLLLVVLLCYVPLAQSRAGVKKENLLLVARALCHRGRSPEKDSSCRRLWCTESFFCFCFFAFAFAFAFAKAALSWLAVIPALTADICSSFCTVSVSCTARA